MPWMTSETTGRDGKQMREKWQQDVFHMWPCDISISLEEREVLEDAGRDTRWVLELEWALCMNTGPHKKMTYSTISLLRIDCDML